MVHLRPLLLQQQLSNDDPKRGHIRSGAMSIESTASPSPTAIGDKSSSPSAFAMPEWLSNTHEICHKQCHNAISRTIDFFFFL
jgi:hypothetical protein